MVATTEMDELKTIYIHADALHLIPKTRSIQTSVPSITGVTADDAIRLGESMAETKNDI